MSRFQFSLASLVGVVLYAAVWCGVLAQSQDYDNVVILTVNTGVIMIFLGASSAAICSRTRRAFWLGFLSWGAISWFAIATGDSPTLFYPIFPNIIDPDRVTTLLVLGFAIIGGTITQYFHRRIMTTDGRIRITESAEQDSDKAV